MMTCCRHPAAGRGSRRPRGPLTASASPVNSRISRLISSTRSRCLMAALYWPWGREAVGGRAGRRHGKRFGQRGSAAPAHGAYWLVSATQMMTCRALCSPSPAPHLQARRRCEAAHRAALLDLVAQRLGQHQRLLKAHHRRGAALLLQQPLARAQRVPWGACARPGGQGGVGQSRARHSWARGAFEIRSWRPRPTLNPKSNPVKPQDRTCTRSAPHSSRPRPWTAACGPSPALPPRPLPARAAR
jgi:hypothetical protein